MEEGSKLLGLSNVLMSTVLLSGKYNNAELGWGMKLNCCQYRECLTFFVLTKVDLYTLVPFSRVVSFNLNTKKNWESGEHILYLRHATINDKLWKNGGIIRGRKEWGYLQTILQLLFFTVPLPGAEIKTILFSFANWKGPWDWVSFHSYNSSSYEYVTETKVSLALYFLQNVIGKTERLLFSSCRPLKSWYHYE